jgi:hypothetical protein
MKNLEYLELPKFSDELIEDVYNTIKTTSVDDRNVIDPNNHGADVKNPAWQSLHASEKLKSFTRTLFDFNHNVFIFYLADHAPRHIDITRDVGFNYVIETGDSTTCFYENDTLTESHQITPNVWHRLDVSTEHSVTVLKPPRILISVSPI